MEKKLFVINFAISSSTDRFVPMSIRIMALNDEDAKGRLRSLIARKYKIVDLEIV